MNILLTKTAAGSCCAGGAGVVRAKVERRLREFSRSVHALNAVCRRISACTSFHRSDADVVPVVEMRFMLCFSSEASVTVWTFVKDVRHGKSTDDAWESIVSLRRSVSWILEHIAVRTVLGKSDVGVVMFSVRFEVIEFQESSVAN